MVNAQLSTVLYDLVKVFRYSNVHLVILFHYRHVFLSLLFLSSTFGGRFDNKYCSYQIFDYFNGQINNRHTKY